MQKNKLLFASVFVCGAVVMVFELAGSRVMAPYYGGSIYIWTGIIGVIMGSLSLGYWLGGKLADKHASLEIFSHIIFLSALAVFLTLILKDGAPALFRSMHLSFEIGSLLAAIILFAPASVLLGLISPYAVRLKLNGLESSGSTVGNLYAASTVGSIVGTFAAGYFLIPFLGTANILFALVLVLGLLSFVFTKKYLSAKLAILLVLAGSYLLLSFTANHADQAAKITRIETEYNSIKVFPGIDKASGKAILSMVFDPLAKQSSMFADSDDLVWDYSKYYRLAGHFHPGLERALMIGGGAYSYPKDFLKQFSRATIDVVEIDPGVTKAAKTFFRLVDDSRLNIFTEDARSFLNDSDRRYDVICDDAFNSSLSVPFQLATVQAVRRQYDMLNENGVVIANIAGAINGDNGRFLRGEYATFKSVFPQVYVFPVVNPANPDLLQNIMIVALKSKTPASFTDADAALNGYLEHRWNGPISNDIPVLTDDFAPVEYYMKKVI